MRKLVCTNLKIALENTKKNLFQIFLFIYFIFRPTRSRASRCSIPSEEALPYNNNNNNYNNNHMINNMTGKIACAVSLTSINSTPTHHCSNSSVKGRN